MQKFKSIHNPNYTWLIEQLCNERRRLGLSQKEVAERIGMTQSEISKIESAERRLDVLEFKALLTLYRLKDNHKLQQLLNQFFGIDS